MNKFILSIKKSLNSESANVPTVVPYEYPIKHIF
jgi:hypothetical protein